MTAELVAGLSREARHLPSSGFQPRELGRAAFACPAPYSLARPFFLSSGNEFLPPQPPAFGSPEYLAALAEVRQISDTRTAERLEIAAYWNLQQSGRRNAAFNNMAVELIRIYRVSDAKAARIMFLMNGAMFDALVGCFDAKYTYWFIRPPQADPGSPCPFACRRIPPIRRRIPVCRARCPAC